MCFDQPPLRGLNGELGKQMLDGTVGLKRQVEAVRTVCYMPAPAGIREIPQRCMYVGKQQRSFGWGLLGRCCGSGHIAC